MFIKRLPNRMRDTSALLFGQHRRDRCRRCSDNHICQRGHHKQRTKQTNLKPKRLRWQSTTYHSTGTTFCEHPGRVLQWRKSALGSVKVLNFWGTWCLGFKISSIHSRSSHALQTEACLLLHHMSNMSMMANCQGVTRSLLWHPGNVALKTVCACWANQVQLHILAPTSSC